MNTKCFFVSFVLLISLLISACVQSAPVNPVVATAVPTAATTATPSTQSNPADRFAGTWSGVMSATDDPSAKANTVTTIPTGCSAKGICGDTINLANGCRWEMTLTAVNGDVFEYIYSKTLDGDCPASGSGTLNLNSDGTLFR